ncbi:MAG: aminotransferase class I/II-fold pyridoxal phosphate-dependent enzyme [Prevotellaceae bacterium]|nr:aminotransferase class I/II-fold pyridoxal phosphate-dependent enzyme [Candidatus Colivivens caballi]
MNYLDRNEFNFSPSDEVVEAAKRFDIGKLCFYTRIYDEGKKSILSVFLSEKYGVEESRVVLGYGGEDILKNAVHYFLTDNENNNIMLIPQFSWWYYKSIADEVEGKTFIYPLYETETTYKYNIDEIIALTCKQKPRLLLLASPNNPTGNCLTPDEVKTIMEGIPSTTMVLIDEAYASFVSSDTKYVADLVNQFSNLLIVRTMSKFFGLPGLRMGFGFIGKGNDAFLKFTNKYLGYNRFSEEIAIAALKSEDHYRNVAKAMGDGRQMYHDELGCLPGFKVYASSANFILIKYPIELKKALQEAIAGEDYKIKFMNEPGIDTHLRITLGRPEQNRLICDVIKKVATENK